MSEQALSESGQLPQAFTPPATDALSNIDRVLDLDAVMSSAKRAERVVRLCLRPDLEAAYYDLTEELGDLVDVNGKPLNTSETETALSEQNRAVEISDQLGALRAQMRAESYTVRFRGMSESEWVAFEKANRSKDGEPSEEYVNKLLVQTAIAPKMTLDQVRALRDQLSNAQVSALVDAAYAACTTGGLDVPKLPSFLPSRKPQES